MHVRCAPLVCALVLLLASACSWGGAGSVVGGALHAPAAAEAGPVTRAEPASESTFEPAAADLAPFARPASATADERAAESPVESPVESPADRPAERPFAEEFLRFERGTDLVPLLVPRAEELVFDVIVDLPIFGETTAGKVVLAAAVEPYRAGLPGTQPAPGAEQAWMGWVQSTATGSHLGYTLHQELKSRLLPQAFPSIFYTDTQTGSENRRKELKLGTQGGKYIDWYRNDGHCRGCTNREHFVDSNWLWGKPSHCDKCKRGEHRVWRPAAEREVPQGTLDMLGSVYLARGMVRDGRSELELQMVDELRLWNVRLAAGKRKRLEVPAGRFDCLEVRLSSSVPPGEEPPKSGFAGLFGLRGTIQIWLDAKHGVPVQIQGEFPIKLISTNLDVYVRLKGYRGAPKGFGPIP